MNPLDRPRGPNGKNKGTRKYFLWMTIGQSSKSEVNMKFDCGFELIIMVVELLEQKARSRVVRKFR